MHEIVLFLAALFAFNFWWAIVIIAIAWVTITTLVETEHGGWATFSLLTALIVYTAWAKYAVFPYLRTHYGWILLYLVGYYIIGTLWSFFAKWPLLIKKHKNLYNEKKKAFLKREEADTLTPNLVGKFKKYLTESLAYGEENLEVSPQVDKHFDDLVRWASFWPWSMFWFVFNDPIRRAFESTIRYFQGTLQKISNRMFADVEAELNQVETAATVAEKLKNVKLEGDPRKGDRGGFRSMN